MIINYNEELNYIMIEKILELDGNFYICNIITIYLEYLQNIKHSRYIKSEIKIDLFHYLENPKKYPNIDYELILKMWDKFMEYDVVEARKWKLKLLEEYGNR